MPSTPLKNRLTCSTPSSPGSPSRIRLSFRQKADICEESLKPGFDKNQVYEKFNISKACLNKILAKKSEFLKIADQKKRFDIRFKTFQGEKASADLEAANEFLGQVLPPLLQKFGEKNTYNCDETGKAYHKFDKFVKTFQLNLDEKNHFFCV